MVNKGKCTSKKGLYFGKFYVESYKLRPHPVRHSLFKATNKDFKQYEWPLLASTCLAACRFLAKVLEWSIPVNEEFGEELAEAPVSAFSSYCNDKVKSNE